MHALHSPAAKVWLRSGKVSFFSNKKSHLHDRLQSWDFKNHHELAAETASLRLPSLQHGDLTGYGDCTG